MLGHSFSDGYIRRVDADLGSQYAVATHVTSGRQPVVWGLWIPITYASCVGSPERTSLRSPEIAADQPILLFTTWGTGEQLARRVRLRDPDGKLVLTRREVLRHHARLSPRRPLMPGTYVVEERGDYDAQGRRIYGPEAPTSSAWFPAFEVEVTEAASEQGPPPVVTYRYGKAHPHADGALSATVETTPETLWSELEVAGRGVVSMWGGRRPTVTLSTTSSLCVDSGPAVSLGPGDVTARVVIRGANGWRATSPWRRMGEGTPGPTRAAPLPASPTGKDAKVSRLPTWRRVGGAQRSDPTSALPSSCGSLQVVEEERHPDSRGVVDEHGRLWVLGSTPEGVTVDGQLLRGLNDRIVALGHHDEVRFVVHADGRALRLSTWRGEQRVATREVVEGRYDLHVTSEELELRWHTAEARWSQSFSHELEPLGEPQLLRRPIVVAHRRGAWTLNGTVVDATRTWVREAHLAVWRQGPTREGGTVVVLDDHAEEVLEMTVPAGQRVEAVRVEPTGVKVSTSFLAGRRWKRAGAGLTWDGQPFEVDPFYAPREEVRRPDIPFGDMWIVLGRRRLAVRDAQGHFTPAIVGSYWVGTRDGHVVVGHQGRDADGERLLVTSYACGGTLGVPEGWKVESRDGELEIRSKSSL